MDEQDPQPATSSEDMGRLLARGGDPHLPSLENRVAFQWEAMADSLAHRHSIHRDTTVIGWLAAAVRERPAAVLDVGCAYGNHLLMLNSRLGCDQEVRLVGLDLHEDGLRYGRAFAATVPGYANVSFATGDLTAGLDFADATFDAINLADVLEHLEDPVGVLRELARITKPGGVIVVSTPLRDGMVKRLAAGANRLSRGRIYRAYYAGKETELDEHGAPVMHPRRPRPHLGNDSARAAPDRGRRRAGGGRRRAHERHEWQQVVRPTPLRPVGAHPHRGRPWSAAPALLGPRRLSTPRRPPLRALTRPRAAHTARDASRPRGEAHREARRTRHTLHNGAVSPPSDKLDQPGRRNRMTAQQRREQLIVIGRSIFAAKGFEAATVEEIAAKAGVSKPVVYEHFGGKEVLYAVVVDREMAALLQGVSAALETPGPTRGLVEKAALALLDYVEASTDGFRILVRDSPAGQSTGTFASLIGDIATQVEALLAREFSRRKLDPKSAPIYAQMLVGMVALTGQWWLDHRSFKKADVAAHLVNLAWNGLVGMQDRPTLRTPVGRR